MKKIRKYIDAKHRDIALLAEAHEELLETAAYFVAGDECQLVYHFPLAEEFFIALVRDDDARLKKMAATSQSIPNGCRWLLFLCDHDDLSLATLAEGEKKELLDILDPERKLIFGVGGGVSTRLASAFKMDKTKINKAFSLLFKICKNQPNASGYLLWR